MLQLGDIELSFLCAEVSLLSISAIIFDFSTYCLLEPALGNYPA
jgi:hypothetical protein